MTVLERDKVLYDIFGMVWYSMFWYVGTLYGIVWCGLIQHSVVFYCMYGLVTVLVQDEVWYRGRGSFMPESVSLVRLELGEIQCG